MTASLLIKIKFILIFFLFASYGFCQNDNDSAKSKVKFDTNKIACKYILDDNSDKYDYDKFIWSDKRNFSEVLNELPGNYIINFNSGGRSLIFSQNTYDKNNGYFRNGIDVSDKYFGGFDIENFSILELDKIEEISPVKSFLYGLNTSGKLYNFISKDKFIPNTFAQLRYSQDRYGALLADLYLTVPLSNKVNFIVDVNNHFSESRYKNSEFSFWRGRFKINYFASPRHNLFFELDYTHNNRRLNGGLEMASNEILSDPLAATVNNLDAYEETENIYWHAGYIGNIFSSGKSPTQLQIHGSFSERNFSDVVNNSRYYSDLNSKSYNIDFKQKFGFKFTSEANIHALFGYSGYFNNFDNNITEKYNRNINSLLGSLSVSIIDFTVDVFSRFNMENENYFNYGFITHTKLFERENSHLIINAGLNKTSTPGVNLYSDNKTGKNYYELSFDYLNNNFNWKVSAFKIKNYFDELSFGCNIFADYNSENIKSYLSLDKFDTRFFPKYNLKFDIAYQNFYFGKKLQLRFGMNMKFAYKFEPVAFINSNYTIGFNTQSPVQNAFNMDFYIGARIGTANINFTIANVFDNLNYNSAVYPSDDRGGFMKLFSRFTIVWDFLN
jgi:hypothetical protein